MTVKVSVKGFQGAKASLLKAIKDFDPSVAVLVGVHEDAGSHAGGMSNAQLGAALHFGAGSSPARPWLDAGVLTGADDYSNVIKDEIKSGGSLDKAMNMVGVMATANAKQFMVDLKSPPNTAATIKAKGSSNPLIDTGQLMQSISYKTTSGKVNES